MHLRTPGVWPCRSLQRFPSSGLPRREEVLSGRQTLRGIDLLVAWSLLGVEFGFIPSLDEPAGQDLMDAKLKAVGERVFECTQFEAWKRRSSLFGLSEFTVSVCVCM